MILKKCTSKETCIEVKNLRRTVIPNFTRMKNINGEELRREKRQKLLPNTLLKKQSASPALKGSNNRPKIITEDLGIETNEFIADEINWVTQKMQGGKAAGPDQAIA